VSGVGCGHRHRAGAALSLALLAAVISGPAAPPVAESRADLQMAPQDPLGGSPDLWIDDARIAEGDSASQVCMFTLHLSEAFAETVSVSVATFDSTATAADLDYQPVSLQVTFAPGSIAESLAVQVIGDRKF